MRATEQRREAPLIELEKSYNERFSAVIPTAALTDSRTRVSYFDPDIVRSEYLNPTVHVSYSGDFAVMGYSLKTYVLDDPDQ